MMEIRNFSFLDNMKGFIGALAYESGVYCLTAKENDKVVGFIIGENTRLSDNILFATEILPEYRNKGVFTKIFKEYKKHAKGNIIAYHNLEP